MKEKTLGCLGKKLREQQAPRMEMAPRQCCKSEEKQYEKNKLLLGGNQGKPGTDQLTFQKRKEGTKELRVTLKHYLSL